MTLLSQEQPLISRVVVEKQGRCIINSPLNPPATRAEVERVKWTPSGRQSFQYDECGVVIVAVF